MLSLSRMAVADLGEDAGHLGVFGGEDALAREKQFEEDCPEERGSGDAADDRQEQDQWCDEDAVAVQEIACSAKPAEEGSDGEAIDGGEAVESLPWSRAWYGPCGMRVADVKCARCAGGRSRRRQRGR